MLESILHKKFPISEFISACSISHDLEACFAAFLAGFKLKNVANLHVDAFFKVHMGFGCGMFDSE